MPKAFLEHYSSYWKTNYLLTFPWKNKWGLRWVNKKTKRKNEKQLKVYWENIFFTNIPNKVSPIYFFFFPDKQLTILLSAIPIPSPTWVDGT